MLIMETNSQFNLVSQVDLTIDAYKSGAFPMAENGVLGFYTCNPRSVFFWDSFHIPKRLKQTYRKNLFKFKLNTSFKDVVEACRKNREEWISDELAKIYQGMHARGHAHSFEAWQEGKLVGGILGTSFGATFLAESMFHTVTHASNCCLIFMIETLKEHSYHFCDIQYSNEHTQRFHPVEVPQKQFNTMLATSLKSTPIPL